MTSGPQQSTEQWRKQGSREMNDLLKASQPVTHFNASAVSNPANWCNQDHKEQEENT